MEFEVIQELINSLKEILQEEKTIQIPNTGEKDKIELKSSSYMFTVDLNRRGIRKPKCSFQLREQQHKEYPLLRLDLIGRTHTNPPGEHPFSKEDIPCPHIHIAHPDYGDSIAYPLNSTYAKIFLTKDELEDLAKVLETFLKRCHVGNIDEYTIEYQNSLFW
ncbi:DUF6978 family protein [Lentibacillus sp.]|uniref:DUF6978 family protein n=1 Tax=Lentibacillus sp. TaxID=1925746 RepID=UPI002B4B581B|nr:hypothetical protein [Lentibacillus sp.]HLS08002.1 hypothetical protein [Lentibacillus sp.]